MSEDRRILKKTRLEPVYKFFKKFLSLFRSSGVTKEEALAIARKYNLETEVAQAMKYGCSPEEALEEWDL